MKFNNIYYLQALLYIHIFSTSMSTVKTENGERMCKIFYLHKDKNSGIHGNPRESP